MRAPTERTWVESQKSIRVRVRSRWVPELDSPDPERESQKIARHMLKQDEQVWLTYVGVSA